MVKNVNVLKEDKVISSPFSAFSNVGALLEQQLHNRLVYAPCGPTIAACGHNICP
jgi:hypothetical protein